nr:uncharacterized protein LOC122269081 [Parasteatoda tepidariorum]
MNHRKNTAAATAAVKRPKTVQALVHLQQKEKLDHKDIQRRLHLPVQVRTLIMYVLNLDVPILVPHVQMIGITLLKQNMVCLLLLCLSILNSIWKNIVPTWRNGPQRSLKPRILNDNLDKRVNLRFFFFWYLLTVSSENFWSS